VAHVFAFSHHDLFQRTRAFTLPEAARGFSKAHLVLQQSLPPVHVLLLVLTIPDVLFSNPALVLNDPAKMIQRTVLPRLVIVLEAGCSRCPGVLVLRSRSTSPLSRLIWFTCPPNGLEGARGERPGLSAVLTELAPAVPKYGDRAAIHPR